MKKSVLFIAYAVPPLLSPGTFHVIKVIRSLVKSGYKVTVLSADTSGYGAKTDEDLAGMIPDDVEIIKTPCEEYYLYKVFKLFNIHKAAYWPDVKILWYLNAVHALKKILKERAFDIIYSRAFPFTSHLIGLFARKMTGLPLVSHFSDPWVDNIYLSRMQRVFMPLNKKMEKDVIAASDNIVFTTGHCRELVMKKYAEGSRSKAMVVSHGFDAGIIPEFALKNIHNEKLRLVFTGDFYSTLRTPVTLFKALKAMSEESPDMTPEIEVLLVGKTHQRYKDMARDMGLSGVVRFIDKVSYLKSFEYMSQADVLLIIDAPMDTPSPFLPSKLIEYLAFRKMILGITPKQGASRELIERAGGMAVEVEDISGIANSIKKCLQMHRDGELSNLKMDESIIAQYDVNNVHRTLIEAFDKLTKDGDERNPKLETRNSKQVNL